MAGIPEGNILDGLRATQVAPLIAARMATATNQLAIEFANLLVDQIDWLRRQDAQTCFQFSTKGLNTTTIQKLSVDLRNRELELNERLLRSRPVMDWASTAQFETLSALIFERLKKLYRLEELQILAAPEKVQPAQYTRYCEMAGAMFREIAQLPLAEAGLYFRTMMKEDTKK